MPIVFLIVMMGLVAVFPVLADLIDNGVVRVLLQVVRWVLIAVLVSVALAVLYRVAPDRDAPKMRWVSVGAAAATVLWLVASLGFSIYVANFSNYAKTYGAIAGIVVMLLWLWITSYAILLGAEINAESEQQTVKDTTKGPEAPLGERDAVKADSLPTEEVEWGQPKSATNQGERMSSQYRVTRREPHSARRPAPGRRFGRRAGQGHVGRPEPAGPLRDPAGSDRDQRQDQDRPAWASALRWGRGAGPLRAGGPDRCGSAGTGLWCCPPGWPR